VRAQNPDGDPLLAREQIVVETPEVTVTVQNAS
jgi:hypothetical protein